MAQFRREYCKCCLYQSGFKLSMASKHFRLAKYYWMFQRADPKCFLLAMFELKFEALIYTTGSLNSGVNIVIVSQNLTRYTAEKAFHSQGRFACTLISYLPMG